MTKNKMNRAEIIRQVKQANAGFFSRSNKGFFKDTGYRWLVSKKLLVVNGFMVHSTGERVPKKTYYTFDNERLELIHTDVEHHLKAIARKLTEQGVFSDNFTIRRAEKALENCIAAKGLIRILHQFKSEIKSRLY